MAKVVCTVNYSKRLRKSPGRIISSSTKSDKFEVNTTTKDLALRV